MTAGVADPATEDWRNPVGYAVLRRIDRAGLMWEWLRRDTGYIAWHAQASQITRGPADSAGWGLHFR